jgi:hypothetical protein
MHSKIAAQARVDLLAIVRRMTPEQRLQTCFEHSRLVIKLAAQGRAVTKLRKN